MSPASIPNPAEPRGARARSPGDEAGQKRRRRVLQATAYAMVAVSGLASLATTDCHEYVSTQSVRDQLTLSAASPVARRRFRAADSEGGSSVSVTVKSSVAAPKLLTVTATGPRGGLGAGWIGSSGKGALLVDGRPNPGIVFSYSGGQCPRALSWLLEDATESVGLIPACAGGSVGEFEVAVSLLSASQYQELIRVRDACQPLPASQRAGSMRDAQAALEAGVSLGTTPAPDCDASVLENVTTPPGDGGALTGLSETVELGVMAETSACPGDRFVLVVERVPLGE